MNASKNSKSMVNTSLFGIIFSLNSFSASACIPILIVFILLGPFSVIIAT